MGTELEIGSRTAQQTNEERVAAVRVQVGKGDRSGHGGNILHLRLNEYDKDEYKDGRQEKHSCKACAYLPLGGMVMWAFTSSACKNCGESFYSPSSDVDAICESCATELNYCKHCTQPMD